MQEMLRYGFNPWIGREEEGMATHSNTLAWRIPQTEEPGGPQSMGSQRDRLSTSHTVFKAGRSLSTGKAGLSQPRGASGGTMTKCDVIYWMGSRSRKRTGSKKLRKSESRKGSLYLVNNVEYSLTSWDEYTIFMWCKRCQQ